MEKIEHIGIAVKDLEASNTVYKKLLGVAPYKREEVHSEKVITSFFNVEDSKIELLEATDADSAIAKFIDKRGEGIHHIAFAVADIRAEMERLQKEGFTLLNTIPVKGADNKWVAFVHPKSAHGVLIEICQEIEVPKEEYPEGNIPI
ncbi:methylmalonyl-CoA epimerase [Arenibacter sp. GZD96]|uniref:methylmalonyl-CoA epimerase n=1 Tax=Aurantibrevibacter litoralis TaxID=3106030 RepID=UPI002AFE4D60|nr:methylmalonyl-CoA epimerase [Arenibacter sp. GZD-96]MEA1787204.1 methylmalonyl-CoA epimerase [Arenibacter sp. GZD-96]